MRGGRTELSTLEADLMHAQWEAMREGVKEAMAAAANAREAAVAEAAGEGAPLEAVAAVRAALPKPVDLGKLVPLIDVSGSMVGTPMEAAIGLGLVVAELPPRLPQPRHHLRVEPAVGAPRRRRQGGVQGAGAAGCQLGRVDRL